MTTPATTDYFRDLYELGGPIHRSRSARKSHRQLKSGVTITVRGTDNGFSVADDGTRFVFFGISDGTAAIQPAKA
ncbi:hypothetical protein [Halovenus sp. HT40]|uniref:hypothetical protein n=1 Tax=Halovenus sp. HT40 TaxID=3126691 RepID=UPI00300F0914